MSDWMEHEAVLRVGIFGAVLLLMVAAETVSPRRPWAESRWRRAGRNVGLAVLAAVLTRLFFAAGLVGVAHLAARRGWGLFHVVETPPWLAVLASLVALDFVLWLQHVVFHAVPALWRLHRVHHADVEFDATTGVRFHPIEILLSMGLKSVAVLLLGVPPVAAVAFELLLNALALFNHSNLRIPPKLDAVLRLLVVTPDMHRVHHSVERDETNSNFGFNLPWWDRLLGTYVPQPRAGHDGMTIGLAGLRDPARLTLSRLLALPLSGRLGPYTFRGRSSEES